MKDQSTLIGDIRSGLIDGIVITGFIAVISGLVGAAYQLLGAANQ